jgi:hypothetical protein
VNPVATLPRSRGRTRRTLTGILIAGATVLAACDDDAPGQQPADTVPRNDSVTTVPSETPSEGSTQLEPGTNLTPTSDEVPDGSDTSGTGDTFPEQSD